MKRLIVLLLMIIPLYGSAQEVWTEGTEWVVTYADGNVHTFTLSGTATFDGTEYIKLLDNQQEEPIGYIRSEHGDTLVYARGVINGKLTEEFLLYDFGSFEPGTSLVYTCYNYETQTPVCFSREIDADSISYYNNVIEEGDIIPCCYGVIFKLGYVGGPMALFYDGLILGHLDNSGLRPNTRNVSHMVFHPKGRKAPVYIPVGIRLPMCGDMRPRTFYDVRGQVVKPPFSGIVIVDGKKYLY